MVYFWIEDSRLLQYTDEFIKNYDGEDVQTILTEQVFIPLRVIRSNGFDVTPDYNVVVTDLNKGSDGFIYKKFYNKGFGGISFKINILLKRDETWHSSVYRQYKGYDTDEHNVLTVLKEIMRTMTPVKVVTDAIDIPNGNYIITKNPSRKQTTDNSTVWELEFTTYRPLSQVAYKNDNTRVKKAIKSATAKKVAVKKTTAKKKTTKASKFSKCKLKVLVYSKKKKTNDCVKQMQTILKNKGFYTGKVDGWFGSMTTSAVKKFQKKYKKKYSLKVTGKVDKKTFEALQKV